MPVSQQSSDLIREIVAGVAVDVRCRYDRHWCTGFTIAALDDMGVTIRRDSDGAVLPVVFALSDVRLVIDSD